MTYPDLEKTPTETIMQVVMVEEGVADVLVEKLKEGVVKLTVGRPEDDCDICHVISKSSADWIEELSKGAPMLILSVSHHPIGGAVRCDCMLYGLRRLAGVCRMYGSCC